MAGANSNINIVDLDFNSIKNNLKTFLKSQDELKDYNYEGSSLSVLLDLLAYNTQYNAYYLNMVSNEMFLDTAIKRSSVVSQAKALGYTPKSAIAPSATVNLTVSGVTDAELTLPKYTKFMSEAIDGVNYTFVTWDTQTVTTDLVNQTASFYDITLKQGTPLVLNYIADNNTNPYSKIEIPDTNVDTSSMQVTVSQSSTNSAYNIYTAASSYTTLDGESRVYFLQEGLNGNYEIYFGDGVLGKKLDDGNFVQVTYLSTAGTLATGANNFVLIDKVNGYSSANVAPVQATGQGGAKETIDSIKFQAPKTFSAQGRAVTKEDYITAIQQNNLGYSFDSISVWGGQENEQPVYGQVFISMKPTGAYNLTATQKQKLVSDVIKPISVLTVEPTIVDPDYTYIVINANVVYDQTKTAFTSNQIQAAVKAAINNFANKTLNTFNSTFMSSELNQAIKDANPSIITGEFSIQLQKKFFPNLANTTTYKLYYGSPLKKGMFQSGVKTTTPMSFRNPSNLAQIINNVYLEELPSSTGGIETVSVLNSGYGYQVAPTVTIRGDGQGATARAVINSNGTIREIIVVTPGTGYTSAIATITPASGDTTGQLGAATVSVEGKYGTLRLYYNNAENVKTVFNNNIGTIDYNGGIVTLNSFNPIGVSNEFGQLAVSVEPTTTIISSSFNRIITVDPYDAGAIVVNVTAKK